MSEITKQVFPSAKLAEAQEAINKVTEIAEKENLPIRTTWDENEGIPEGFGIAIIPQREGKGSGELKTVGVTIAIVPDFETVEKHEKGRNFIIDTINDKLLAKVANAIRNPNATVPTSLEHFVSSTRPEGLLKTFNEIGKDFRKVLAEKMGAKGKLFSMQVFRSCLESSAFAEAEIPNWPQEVWQKVLDSMIAKASEKGMNTEILEQWKNERDHAGMPEVEEISVDDLEF